MSESIWKFPLQIEDYQEILMPHNAEILCVQMQNNTLCLWAQVSTENSADKPTPIFVVGTGNPLPRAALNYIGTVQQYDGSLVWHVYSGEKS